MCHEALGKERVHLAMEKSVKELQNFAVLLLKILLEYSCSTISMLFH